jgi:hypothetical protein
MVTSIEENCIKLLIQFLLIVDVSPILIWYILYIIYIISIELIIKNIVKLFYISCVGFVIFLE